jgi:hypothetical protein
MRSLAGTIEAAQDQYPELYWKHDEVCKKLEKVRRTLRQEAKQKMREEYYDTMPINEVDKQIDQLVDNPDADLSDSEDMDEDWNPPIPEYVFPERARIVEAFYGPEAETLEGDLALARRIQVTKDMTALCGLWEPNRRGRIVNWNKEDDTDDKLEHEDSPLGPEVVKCSIDVCIICLGLCIRSGRRPRKFRRIDSLRCHLIDVHFKHMTNDAAIHCTLHSQTERGFTEATTFLHHVATIHDYDPKIRPCHFQRYQRRRPRSADVWSMKELKIKMTTDSLLDSTTDSTVDLTTDITMSGTQTPASSVDSDILLRIDPRLLTGQVEVGNDGMP